MISDTVAARTPARRAIANRRIRMSNFIWYAPTTPMFSTLDVKHGEDIMHAGSVGGSVTTIRGRPQRRMWCAWPRPGTDVLPWGAPPLPRGRPHRVGDGKVNSRWRDRALRPSVGPIETTHRTHHHRVLSRTAVCRPMGALLPVRTQVRTEAQTAVTRSKSAAEHRRQIPHASNIASPPVVWE
jgi:hypothetical protein